MSAVAVKFRGVSRRNRNTGNAKYFNEKRNLPFFLREKKLSVLRETRNMLLKLYRDCSWYIMVANLHVMTSFEVESH